MSDFPDPFTPPDCDLRGMPYMPLDIVRLFDSDFYVLTTGDEFKAGVSLWGKAFLQVPAGSLPKDDRLLAHLSGSGPNWRKVKEMALRGWVECSDGRLYHRTVAEKCLEAWKARCDRRARTEAARAARQTSRALCGSEPPPSVTDTVTTYDTDDTTEDVTDIAASPVTISVTDDVTGSKGREGKGREGKIRKKELPFATLTPSAHAEAARDPPEFQRFWSAYPRKVGKGAARRAFAKASAKAEIGVMLAAIDRTRWHADPQFIPHPATWLSQERWLDEQSALDPVLAAAGIQPDDFFPPIVRMIQ